MSVLSGLRRLWLNVHLWIGVALFIPFAALGLTGTALVWRAPLDHQLNPQRYAVSAGAPASFATDLANARAAFGDDFVVTALRPPADAGDPLVVQARKKGKPAPGQRPEGRSAWLDPATARVLDVASPRGGPLGFAHDLHGNLMMPGVGRQIVGWLGVAMLFSSLTGIWLWWPRGKFLAGFRWARGPRTTYNLHHFAGFWLSLVLATLALTGAYISFPRTAASVTSLFVETKQPDARGGPGGPGGNAPPLAHTTSDIDAVAQAALGAAPGARIVSITLPTRSRDADAPPPSWRVQVSRGDGAAPATINVDDETGAAKAPGQRANTATSGEEVARTMRRIHDGDDLSPIWQWLIAITGFAPALLGITGLIMWLRRDAAKRALRETVEPAAVAAE